jgi:hypothetical protein|eukprot:scaffold3816_cov182-Alexandrium_tamarense.AAC.8
MGSMPAWGGIFSDMLSSSLGNNLCTMNMMQTRDVEQQCLCGKSNSQKEQVSTSELIRAINIAFAI